MKIGDMMKKLFSILLAFVSSISIFLLIIIFSIQFLVSEKTISKIASKIHYLELVNIDEESSELKENYDSIYLSLKDAGISNFQIKKFYETDFFEKIATKVIYIESNYLLTGKALKTYTIDELNNLSSKTISQMNQLKKEEQALLTSTMQENNLKILTMENIIRSDINNITYSKLQVLRYFFSNTFKVILLCLIIISILLQYFLNKEKMFAYIFIPIIICCVIELVFSILLPSMFFRIISNSFLESILYFYVRDFSNYLLLISLILLIISAFYLMVHESIAEKMKKRIRPKIKKIKVSI